MVIVNTLKPQQTILSTQTQFYLIIFKIMHHSTMIKFTPKVNFRIDLTHATYVLHSVLDFSQTGSQEDIVLQHHILYIPVWNQNILIGGEENIK